MARRIAVRRGPVCSVNFRVEDAARHDARVHAADLRHLVQRVLGDDEALRCSKDWVNAIVSDAGICPFSLSADRAGLPLGDVRYDVTRADDTETCFQWFWKEVQWLEDHPRHATSLLLMTNPYWASNFDAFEQFGDALTQALQSATESKVEGLGFEGQIQLVFFHPQYVRRAASTVLL